MAGNTTSAKELAIKVADWATDREQLSDIRRLVFIEEQKVPEDMEWDEFDSSSIHFLATQGDQAVACARLKPDGQIGRMAVLPHYRNRGFGTQLLHFILQIAEQKHIDRLTLHAQVSAIPFYEKLGFIAQGEVFYEAGIPHREMRK